MDNQSAGGQGAGESGRYPIGVVARRTGLSPHVLRAWERRYGLVAPGRTEQGQRVYTDADVLRLRLLRQATEAGHPIGMVAGLSTEELQRLVRGTPLAAPEPALRRAAGEEVELYLAACLRAVEAMDGARVHATLMRAVVALDSWAFIDQLAVPLLRSTGELWEAGSLDPGHEHLLSAGMRRVLAWLMDAVPVGPDAAAVVVTTPAGERHELGAMLAAVVGWRVVYLGPDLPAEDVARAAERAGAGAVALSVVHGPDGPALLEEVRRLRARMPPEALLLIGGAGTAGRLGALAAAGATWLPDLRALRDLLRARARELDQGSG